MGLAWCDWRSSLKISYVRTPSQEMCGVCLWDAYSGCDGTWDHGGQIQMPYS